MYGGGGDYGAGDARRREQERQQRIRSGMASIDSTFAQFDQPFFDQRAQAYQDYAMPVFGQEYRTTANSLAFNLARRGLRNSSAAIDQQASLGRERDRRLAEIANAARGEAQQLQRDVEDQRSDLVGQLHASADPSSISAQALNRASMIQQPSAWRPIGNFFDDWSRVYLANQNARAMGDSRAPAWPMIFGGGGGWGSSGRVVGG